MTTCATCKYWGEESWQELGLRKCNKVIPLWDATAWDEDFTTKAIKPEHADKKAFAQDGSDYYACLKTMGDFGCNQFEAASKGGGND